MTPPHPEAMRRALLRDPFWVAPSEVDRLTDREMFEWYIKPALEKQRQDEGNSAGDPHGGSRHAHRSVIRPDDPDGTVRDEHGRIVAPEAVLMMLAGAGIADPAQVADVIRRKRERDEAEKAAKGGA